MEKFYRITDDGDRWSAVICYNSNYYTDYYFSKETYGTKEVIALLVGSLIIRHDTPLIGDDVWPEVQKRHAEVMAYEREHGLNTEMKWIRQANC